MNDDSAVLFFFVGLIGGILIIIWTYGCVEDYRAGQCFDRTKNERCYETLREKKAAEPKGKE